MNDEEYREFLTSLFERYIRPRISRVRRRFDHHMENQWSYHVDQAASASHALRFIESDCDDNNDVYETLTPGRLSKAVRDASYCVDFCNRVTEEAGFVDALEAHASEILVNLHPRHLPEVEKEILRDMGSINPDAEIRELAYAARASSERIERSAREVPIRGQLKRIEERLDLARKDFSEWAEKNNNSKGQRPEHEKRSRRWFKGLGQIVTGSALSIADVALALGVLNFPVTPETRSWGSVASVSTGIGTILGGIGDLRNE